MTLYCLWHCNTSERSQTQLIFQTANINKMLQCRHIITKIWTLNRITSVTNALELKVVIPKKRKTFHGQNIDARMIKMKQREIERQTISVVKSVPVFWRRRRPLQRKFKFAISRSVLSLLLLLVVSSSLWHHKKVVSSIKQKLSCGEWPI